MNQLEAMRAFARVAELGSFTRAAEALDLSRAVVSAQVQALERHLGVALFARTTRRVTLTGDGSSYLQRCRRILEEVEVADDEMRRLRERVQGRLRVDMPAMFGRYLLLPELPAFTTRYPELQLEIQYNDRVIDLGAEGVDVAVRFAARRDPKLIARPIGATRLLICAAPGYLLQHGAPASIEELRQHRLIGQLGANSGRPRDWLFRIGAQTRRVSLPVALTFNSIEGALQAALSGMGLVQTADIVVQDLVRRGRLEVVLAVHAAGGAPVSVVYQRVRRIPAKVRVFADFTAGLFERWNVSRATGSTLTR
jgi:LysR family transcriptional regulator for bpeEF and oprC